MLFLINFVFFFTLAIIVSYVMLGIYSSAALDSYLKRNSYVDFDIVSNSPLLPSVSVIAPAFNEEDNVINSVKNLMNLHYTNYELIIVNDGSTDRTFELLKDEFELEKTSYYFEYKIPCKRIRGVYKSTNPMYKKLTVVDKINGGCKADANNGGLNIAKNDLVTIIDVDSVIEKDSLIKLAKPFIEYRKRRVIATGGVVRILNSCEVKDGTIKKINIPKRFLAKFQALEYLRSFLLGRMAWSKLDGLLIISGAMGMFDRRVLMGSGGYDVNAIGEDMELTIRMRRYMADRGEDYEITYIPDPLCWTEVPDNVKTLRRQRERWTRGLVESLKKHKEIFMRKKYGKLGMLGYPFWFVFEWLAPVIAFIGMIYTAFLAVIGSMNWPFFLVVTSFIYSFSILLSTWSILYEEITFHKYNRKRDVLLLVGTAFIEPFLYIMLAYFAIRGNIQHIAGKNEWY